MKTIKIVSESLKAEREQKGEKPMDVPYVYVDCRHTVYEGTTLNEALYLWRERDRYYVHSVGTVG